MKTKLTTNNNQSFLRRFAVFLALLTFFSCEQPFRAGLGPVIDLQAPIVVLEEPNPKLLYIRGVVNFTGYANDDYKLDSVWFTISEYQDIDLNAYTDPYMPKYRKMNRPEGVFYGVEKTGGNDRHHDWKFTINTKMLADPNDPIDPKKRVFLEGGYFKIRMLAIDSVGKEALTDDIVYIIKNDRPQISMTYPGILPGTAPGDIGGDFLNYGFIDAAGYPSDKTKPSQFPRWMATEGYMSGTIHDDQGINYTEEGTEVITDENGDQKTVELFLPQIRFWQVDMTDLWTGGDGELFGQIDKLGNPIQIFQLGYIPTLAQVPWVTFSTDKNAVANIMPYEKDATFLYKLPKESGTSYGFEVRAQSKDTLRSSVRYPRDYNPDSAALDSDPNPTKLTSTNLPQIENACVLVTLREPTENPILELYELQDIKDGLNTPRTRDADGLLQYPRLPKDEITGQLIDNDVAKNGNHSYVDKPIVNKSGPFILRMKASHSGGIKSAAVYWEKDDDKSYRGRFIWDPVDFSKHTQPWPWKTDLGEPVPTSAPYQEWGFKEPDADLKVRSFVYTYYDDPAKDKVPNTGRSTVQKYTGPVGGVNDNGDYSVYDYDQLPETAGYWSDVTTRLLEGTYNLYIYTTSNSDTRVAVPYTVTIKIDRGAPEIELFEDIDGSAGEFFNEKNTSDPRNGYTIVNGVIRPKFRISDSRAEDSGIRTGTAPTSYFERPSPDTGYYPEQMYVLVPDSNKFSMDEYLKNNPLKTVFDNFTKNKTSPPITISSQNPIIDDNTCLIRTSHIYIDETDGYPKTGYPADDPWLDDGIYWIYAFARDNAFNVGKLETPRPIWVQKESDLPTMELFDPIDENVIEPDSSYDLGGGNYNHPAEPEKSFITADGIRNKFSANSSIRVRIKDDDSLDLGVQGGAASGIKVTFIGSKPDATGVIKPYEASPGVDDPAYLITLSDADVKEIFGTQSTYTGHDEETGSSTATLRRAVKDVTGVISQTALLNGLKNNPNYNALFGAPAGEAVNPIPATSVKHGFTSLPDGIYRVSISIQDYNHPSIKLRTQNDAKRTDRVNNRADIKTAGKVFWIAVDTKAPLIEPTLTTNDGLDGNTMPSGSFISSSKDDPANLTGKVSDENGPITFVGWAVYGDSPTGPKLYSSSEKGEVVSNAPYLKTPCPPADWLALPAASRPDVPSTWWTYPTAEEWGTRGFVGGKWTYDFNNFQMNLNDNIGTFTFELQFKDRFGNTSTMSLKYSVDNEPPKVSLSIPIPTFERVEDDVYLDNRTKLTGWNSLWEDTPESALTGLQSYIQLDSSKEGRDKNKTRLAVKVVNFTINPTDNFKVKGVRWWLLPADTGSGPGGYIPSSVKPGGQVLDYKAFPGEAANFDKVGVYYSNGDYYNSTTNTWGTHSNAAFNKGAYGVVDVVNRKFTIAVDTEKMLPAASETNNGNGEYRLHIIAMDGAGLYSTTSYSYTATNAPNETVFPIVNVLQEVFFLQEEDRPYFGAKYLKDEDGNTTTILNKNITPGARVYGIQWPADAQVLPSTPYIKGTVWDNNGFSRVDSATERFWPGTVSVWFTSSGAEPPATWEKDLETGDPAGGSSGWTDWIGPKKVPGDLVGGLGGTKTLSLNLGLSDLFGGSLGDDGNKRYIIKVTDSPNGKLSKATGEKLGMGDPAASSADEVYRVSRARQYAFIYDAKPPVITVLKPKPPVDNDKFGTNLDDPVNGFILKGIIEDKNLATMSYYYQETNPAYNPDDPANAADKTKYYFEYYLDNNSSNRQLYILEGSELDIITAGEKVEFTIQPAKVAAQIIPKTDFIKDDFAEGQHTLYLFAFDKSGKEGAAMVSFTKDMKPPSIEFTTLDEKPYDNTNKSIVHDPWWTLNETTRQPFVFGSSQIPLIPAVTAIPAVPSHKLLLTTIYYDSNEVPTISGTITDLVSEINLTLGTNTNVGPGANTININGSTFKYWIDGESTERYFAVIEGSGTSVRWTINLTNEKAPADGLAGTLKGKPLVDGIHTIRLEVADTANNETVENYMVAFRVDSKPPTARITGFSGALAAENVVYGDVRWQRDPIFEIGVWGHDANLKDMTISITDQAGNKPVNDTFTTTVMPLQGIGAWIYTPFNYPPPTPPPIVITPPLPSLNNTTDNIMFTGSYKVGKSGFTSAPSGDYEVVLTARDYANNESEQDIKTFTYDKTQPEIVFTNPPDTNVDYSKLLLPEDLIDPGDLSTPGIGHRITSEQLKIEGMVTDEFSAIRQVQSQVWKWNWLTAQWEIIEQWTNVRNDLYYPSDSAKNNKLRQISWTKNLLGQDGTQTKSLNLGDTSTWTPGLGVTKPVGPDSSKPTIISPEGLYCIQIRAKDASYIQDGLNQDYSDSNWIYPPASPTATTPIPDTGNPVQSQFVYFFYDRTNPELKITGINGSDTSMQTYYSKPADGFTFKGEVTDLNRFAKVEVVMQAIGASPLPAIEATRKNITDLSKTPTINQGEAKQTWEAKFSDAANYPDGRYKVTITVYDMTGRSAKEEKSFILDSTNPGMKFTGPAKDKEKDKGFGEDQDPPPNFSKNFASVIVNGGETSVITGETWDLPGAGGEKGSESGVDQMWFRLGYIDGSTAFPTRAAIEADELAILKAFVRYATPALTDAQAEAQVKAMSVTARNAAMDEVAKYVGSDSRGNAWFKLGGSDFPRPTGFVIKNPNIYDWRMEIPNHFPAAEDGAADLAAMGLTTSLDKNNILGYAIGGLKLYGKGIKVKGRDYEVNPAATVPVGTRQMVRSVPNQAGIYRLPLWVRLVDKVGNVEYGCHDIWIYPDGDIPTTTIESPDNGNQNNARGGAISVDGVARSNTSVYDVIFRVFADGTANTDLDGTGATKPYTPNPAEVTYDHNKNWVRVTGYDVAEASTIALLPAAYKPGAGAQWTWQRANLTLTGGSGEPLIPWSIMLNSGDQIRDLISDRGFPVGDPDKIRVWLEIFVFNGEGSPIRSSIYADDLRGTANGNLYGTADPPGTTVPTNAKPYVRAFYIKTAAPAITHPNVGSWSTAPNANQFVYRYENVNASGSANYGYKGAGTETRKDRFSIKAILDPKGSTGTGYELGEVSYRVKLDGGAYNTWATLWKTGDPALPYNKDGIRITQRTESGLSPNRTRYDFVYAFNSMYVPTAAAPNYTEAGITFAPVNGGLWANSGGTITVQVRIRDTASPPNEAEQTIQVSVDNFAPVADTEVYLTNSKVAGTNVDFMGRVFDYAKPVTPLPTDPDAPGRDSMNSEYTPRKVSKVYAWFTKNGQYVNMNTGKVADQPGVTPPATRTMSVLEGRAANVDYEAAATGGFNYDKVTNVTLTNRGKVNTARQLPTLGSQAAHNADWVREISESTATPGTRMLWSPVNSAVYDIRWSFNIDTTVLPDGKMTLHYIVEDAAVVTIKDADDKVVVLEMPGNASYYTQDVSVRNHYPQIDRVTLYTDNNGIGAVYTTHTSNNIASTEYDLNNYRNKMFANYSDPSDYTAPSAAGKLDSVGYLNSGFISKNQYIGFKVETSYGNRDLNFRLQYVTRERKVLNKATLDDMVDDRNAKDPTKINLYTIAWHGDYSNAKWRALGVPIDNPMLGTHFVFNPVNTVDPSKAFDTAAAAGTAEVWKYTAVKTRPAVTPTGQPADDTVVFGPDSRFEFNKANAAPGDFGSIPELMGSHPDTGDSKPNDPKTTAFFLIRVWDTVNPPTNNSSEEWVNEQLYDALVVGMNVYLKDTTPPTVRLYDLNPYTETAVVGNNLGTATDPVFGGNIDNTELTIRNALDPRGIGENILRGGLFNTKTERELVRSGHIEPRSGTPPPTNPNTAYNGSALHPRIKNPVTRVYETYEADGLIEGDSETNTYHNGINWVTVTKDLVSGKIILRGSAWDDQLIREIRVGIGATQPSGLYTISDKTNTILELDTTGTPSTNPNYLTMKPSFVSGTSGPRKQAWAAEELHWKTGHTVEWAYVWDTEKVPNASGTPASDIKVWVAVIDKLGNSEVGLPSSNVEIPADTIPADPKDADKATFKNMLTVDIVPYITGIERDPAKFVTRRSLQGWYSFFQGEQNVSIVGYNLKGSGDSAVTIQHGSAAGDITTPTITGTQTINRITFTVPAGAQSGKIILKTNVTVGGSQEALNHRTRDRDPAFDSDPDLKGQGWSWNKEAHYYTDGSDLWINKPYAHIWRTQQSTPGTIGTTGLTGHSTEAPLTYMGTTTSSSTTGSIGLNHPGMALEYVGTNSGRLHGAWAVYGYANVYYGHNNNASNNLINATPNEPYATPDISIFEGGNKAPNNTTSIANIGFSYQADGEGALNVKSRTATGAGNTIQTASVNPTQRWQNVRISKALENANDSETNVGRIYMTAWDARYNSLWFGTRNGTTNTVLTLDGPTGGAARISDSGNGLAPATSAGDFSAVDYDATGPIVAYYDKENDTLRIALGLNTAPTTASGQWNRKYVLPSTHELYRGSGRYVSIKVDKSGGIHLAFLNSTKSTVVYAYAASRSADFTAYAIDDVVKGGTWTDISVDNNGNPWIVYGDSTRTGNYDGARMAYRSGTTTGIQFTRDKKDPVTGTVDITGWEAVSMPAQYEVNNDRLNIEAWPPTVRGGTLGTAPGWNAAIGYASHMFRIGYFFYPKYKDGNY